MHATYLFYMGTDSLETVTRGFKDWAERHCTENNSYQELYVLNSEGDQRILVESDDYRGRDKTARKLAADFDTIEEMWRFAWSCTIMESGIFESLSSMLGAKNEEGRRIQQKVYETPLDEITDWFLKEAHGRIIDAYTTGWTNDDIEGGYRRRKMVRYFEAILEERHYDSPHPPFVRFGGPTDFRAFYLYVPEESTRGGESILAVDIHT